MSEKQLQERIARLKQELRQSRDHEKMLEGLLERKVSEIYIHYHIARTIGSLLGLPEMLRRVMEIIGQAVPLDRVTVYLLDEPAEKLELAFSRGLDIPQQTTLMIGEGVPGRIAEKGEHVHIHDLSDFYESPGDFLHHRSEEKRPGSFIGIALKVRTSTIGVICMDNKARHGLTVDDMDFMAIVSHQIASGIETSRLFEQIKQVSQRDGLTGLYNHRTFQERLEQELRRRVRTLQPLSIIMLDIDHFKKFNDNYGHQAGDAVLRELSRIIESQTRCSSIDICCRYGGEEFAVIMPDMELSNAVEAAERLRRTVETAVFAISEQALDSRVTISLGVAGISGRAGISPAEVVKQADDALYESKRNGRNRVSSSRIEQ